MSTTNIRSILAAVALLSSPAYSGFYLGAQAGAALMRGDILYSEANVQQPTAHARKMGAAYGGQLGYMYHFKNSKMVLMGEGTYLKESSKTKKYDLSFPSSTLNKGTLCVEGTRSFGGSLGVGVFVNPKVGFYGKVGFENKGLKTTYTLPGNIQTYSGKKTAIWSVVPGLGFIYKPTDSIGMGLEYNYLIGKKYNVLPQTTNANGTYSQSIYFTPTEHRLLFKINYMFA
ncbi:MAG: outer membrane beta-barrel protein [Candidatus Paracaedibacteraceae bacterium]|nr:outer membrane beta-barrel protein [Candidatus Paracaedibacteraceae bacterium]